MAISTYNELTSAVGNWLARTDLTARVPEFITLGEARIGREVRARVQEQRSTSSTVDGNPYLVLPVDWLEPRTVWITASGRSRKLTYATPDALMLLNGSVNGTPTHYTIIGEEIRFGPPPSGVIPVELWYYKRLVALSSALNALFTYNPDIYLYAALLAATPYLKDDKRLSMWRDEYMVIKNSLNATEEAGRRGSDGGMVMG